VAAKLVLAREGIAVSDVPTATDETGDSSAPLVFCLPASGSTLPVGSTTVNCTAADSDDANNPITASFTVNVTDIGTLVLDTISLVHRLRLPPGLEHRFVAHLSRAFRTVEAGNAEGACDAMGRFTRDVRGESGERLTARQANELLARAAQIQTGLGC
jgi:hypothetical protein